MKTVSLEKQRGFALVIALVLLVGLMLLGVSSMTTSGFDEKVAGGYVNRTSSYLLAESAIRAGERAALALDPTQNTGTLQSAYIPRQPAGASAFNWDPTADSTGKAAGDKYDWSNATQVPVPGMRSTQIAAYVIEELDDNYASETDFNVAARFKIYRITARGSDTSKSNNSAVILQSVVRRTLQTMGS